MAWPRKFWSRMSHILIREGAAPRVYYFFFKTVVQTVLFFGAENWVVTPCIGKALWGFQTQVARRLTGRHPWSPPDGSCRCTSVEVAR